MTSGSGTKVENLHDVSTRHLCHFVIWNNHTVVDNDALDVLTLNRRGDSLSNTKGRLGTESPTFLHHRYLIRPFALRWLHLSHLLITIDATPSCQKRLSKPRLCSGLDFNTLAQDPTPWLHSEPRQVPSPPPPRRPTTAPTPQSPSVPAPQACKWDLHYLIRCFPNTGIRRSFGALTNHPDPPPSTSSPSS